MFSMMSNDIGIDLGTASILVYIKGKGVVLKEPSVVAIDRDTNKIMAIGEEARLRQGVISDYTITEKMLKYFISKAVGKKTLRKPRISVCIPSGATEVEKKAVEDATYQAGAREVAIIEEPVAAAIGAGIDIGKACGNMIVDIGGGTADIAVISLGGPVVSTSIKIAGDDFDEALVRYMRKKHNLLIGERTAEEIKINIGGPDHGSQRTQPGDWSSKDHRGYLRRDAGGTQGACSADCGCCPQCIGAHPAGAGSRYF